MTIIHTVAGLRAHLEDVRGHSIGFVPTMGALHEGHLSLLRAARAENDVVVLSIFVNPAQFDDPSDLAAYPRTIEHDVELARSVGVDVVFAPDVDEVYPDGFATSVSVRGLVAETLEGARRGAGHFDGVATVVTKLLMAVLPRVAYFGAKDAQQVAVVRRLVVDLGIPVRIAVCPTSRDDDGLARSSRNTRLSPEERDRALSIPRALAAVETAVAAGETDAAALRSRATDILGEGGTAPEYVAFVDPLTFVPAPVLERPVLMAIAARVGAIRLIDNTVLTPGGR
ncbi:pantoate--beta-alanine ligase [Microbacterium sp. 18062]|uniref:pantoate--beta-alanine ligase n=1 Tax=Microbacterium sp. 18062 TaxID=2681410 RepID=UPI001357A76E|nr:pantoate--beta-alanine ligase [Microbacterium sp. 18062]